MRDHCHWITICSDLRTRLSSEADVEQIFSFSGRVMVAENHYVSLCHPGRAAGSNDNSVTVTVKSLYANFKPTIEEIIEEHHNDICDIRAHSAA